MTACLVLTSAPVAPLEQLTTLLAAQGLPASDAVALATSSGGLAAGALSAGAYDAVVSVAAAPGHHTVQLLGLLAAALRPGGKLVVQEVGAGGGAAAVQGPPAALSPETASLLPLTAAPLPWPCLCSRAPAPRPWRSCCC